MPDQRKSETTPDDAMIYRIRIEGHLGSHWSEWLGGLTLSREEGGDTLLTAQVVDQAELYGLLRKVRDLGLPLLSVTRAKPDGADEPKEGS